VRSVIAWLAVNAFFVAICVAFSAVFLGLAKLGNAIAPTLMEESLFTYPLGLLALAATLVVAYKVTKLIG
jgi:divalent metal cation (Fe/Co/Zn/Cd) transporter